VQSRVVDHLQSHENVPVWRRGSHQDAYGEGDGQDEIQIGGNGWGCPNSRNERDEFVAVWSKRTKSKETKNGWALFGRGAFFDLASISCPCLHVSLLASLHPSSHQSSPPSKLVLIHSISLPHSLAHLSSLNDPQLTPTAS